MNNTTFADYGINTEGRTGKSIRCICPECQHLHNNNNKTLSADTGQGLWHCFRCSWAGAVKTCGSELHIYIPKRKKVDDRRWAKDLIDETIRNSAHISESPEVLAYLETRLGVLPDPLPKLGAHPNLGYYMQTECLGYYPAMIATVRDVKGKIQSVHRTYIQDGKKAPVEASRKLMKAIKYNGVRGCAIHLYEPTDELIVAEGIETALAVYLSTGIPVWACISASGLASVVIPKSVKHLTIAADNDFNGTGQRAADELASRYLDLKPKLMMPDKPGTDWLDVLKGDV